MNPRRRVAITGIGMVTPVGNDARTTWAHLQAARSDIGLATIQYFDASGFPVRIGAEVKGFDAETVIGQPKLMKFATRSVRFALAAAEEAFRDAGIRPEAATCQRWGFCAGAGMMGQDFAELQDVHSYCDRDGEFNPDGLLRPDFPTNPVEFCRNQTNAGLALLTRYFGINGYATAVHTACASGGQALGTALKVMRRGQADFMLAGG